MASNIKYAPTTGFIAEQLRESEGFETFPEHSLYDPPSRRSDDSVSSEYSSTTPTFSAGFITRFPSSTTSTTSSPPALDQVDLNGQGYFSKRSAPVLPDVQEDPMERAAAVENAPALRMSYEHIEGEEALSPRTDLNAGIFSSDPNDWNQSFPHLRAALAHPRQLESALASCFSNGFDVHNEPQLKRRCSGESKIASRVLTHLPSLAKRRDRKRATTSRSEGNSGFSTPQPRSRSTSRARGLSFFRRSESADPAQDESQIKAAPERIQTIEEVADGDHHSHDLHPFEPLAESREASRPEALERVQTPLLPILVDPTTPVEQTPQPSSFNASKYQDLGVESVYPELPLSIQATPRLSAIATPQLSAKNSISVIRPSPVLSQEPGPQLDNLEASLLSIPDDDEWSDRLGHANFVIRPEPYLPHWFSSETCAVLLADWDKARSEYSRHLARTGKHFGQSSKTYRLTEEKWAEIDGLWKRNYDEARSKTSLSEGTPPDSPNEPAPVFKIPSLDQKFPELREYDIVGPMERAATPERAITQVRRTESRKTGFMKFFGGLNRRARSASGPR